MTSPGDDDPTSGPPVDPALEPATDPSAEPAAASTAEPAAADPTLDPAADPALAPAADLALAPAADLALAPAADLALGPAADLALGPAADPALDPAADLALGPAADLALGPAADLALGPAADPALDPALVRLGWDAAWHVAHVAADPDRAWQPVRIAAEHRGAYQALGPGGTAWVELTGRRFHTATDKRDLPTVGDWILVERWPEAAAGAGAGVIRAVLPRRSFLVRRAAGEATVPQPVAANVDTGIILTSANADLSPARIDRYASLLRDGGITPALALSKIDLVPDPAPLIAQLSAIISPVVAVSVVTGEGVSALRALGGPGTTCVLIGSSGVGKSSLLNAIAGTAQPTRGIRADDRGRHTTTRREMFATDTGGLWIDTPGMRELGQWIDDPGAAPAFDDIIALAASCRFRDCSHRDEPGCAVTGAIPADRLASFHKLAGERRTGAARQGQAGKLAETRKARAKKPPPPGDD